MLSSKTIPSLQFFCPACAGGMETPIAWGGQQRPCPHCATSVAVPLVVGLIPEPGSPEGGEKRRILKVRTPAMPGSRLGENVSKEPPRLPKPGVVLHEGGGPVVQASPSILKSDNPRVPAIPAEPSPEIAPIALSVAPSSTPFPAPGGGIPGVFQTPWVAGAPRREVSPDQVVHSGAVPPPVPWAVSSFISPSCKLAGWGKKSPLRRRLGIFVPVVGAALLCSAAVAAWRVWPASGYFPYLLEPDAEMLFHYQPPPPRVSLVPTAESRADLFEEFAAEGFHFRPPTDYWERLDQAASPFSLLRPAFTLRRTESSPPSEFGIASCDFAISTDILPTGTGVDDGWQNLPSIVALQARFSCGLPERYEVNISGSQQGRFLRLVWDMLPAENGEPARHLEMWVQQRGRIAWSLTGIMPGSTASYSLTSTLQRLASGFSALDVDPELIRLSLNDRDLSGAALVSSLPTPHLLHRWTSLPPGTTTWPGGQFLAPGADTTWAVGRARIALVTLPPDGLGGLPPSRLLTGMRQLWPALRGLSFPSIDPSDSPDGKTFRLTVAGTFDGSAAQCVVHWHRSPQGAVMAFAFQPEAVDFPTPDPALLLGGLDLIPQPADKAGPPAPPSAVYLPLLDALAGEAQADGRPKEASALHLALFGRSHRLEDLATACGSLAAGGQLDTAIRLFEAGGERFTHTPGWELYRILVMARLGAGPLAHRHAMDLLSSRRFPGSLASPYLNALIESRSWPQAKTFASMLVRNDPASAQWRLHYASILGVTGTGPLTEQLHGLLTEHGIDTSGLLASDEHETIVKTRVVARGQQVARIDRETIKAPGPALIARTLAWLDAKLPEVDAVIIEDYAKGFLTQELVVAITQRVTARGLPVTVDPNPGNPLRWHQATTVKPNRKEAFEAAGIPDPGDVPLATLLQQLPALGQKLWEKWDAQQLLITLGEHGMALLEKRKTPYHTPTRAREVFDVSGAGDTAIALYTLALAAGCPGPQAAEISNLASGVVVAKAGTATLTPEELLAAADG